MTAPLFPWETLYSIIGGRSALDVPQLGLTSMAEANEFLSCYGFRWSQLAERRELEQTRRRSLDFLNTELLVDEPTLQVPQAIAEEKDVRRLLLMASGTGIEQQWACALLRVMHVFAHAHSMLEGVHGENIRTQILDRFQPHIHQTPAGLRLGEGADAIPLMHWEMKSRKTPRSIALKLLCKAENVASPVFDRLGVRLITEERFDTLLAIRYLRLNHVIMFANVVPGRSRNTLIDLSELEPQARALDDAVAEGRITAAERLTAMRALVGSLDTPERRVGYNPHTSTAYHSIQFTCRHLIRLGGEGALDRFFFPYEVQITDRHSHELTLRGTGSHDEYKARQRQGAKERVLVNLLKHT